VAGRFLKHHMRCIREENSKLSKQVMASSLSIRLSENMPRRCAIPHDSPKFFKILRIEMKNYSHHHDNGNVLNRTSMDVAPFITNLPDEIQISVLLIETKKIG
jgi:hypothetical protein